MLFAICALGFALAIPRLLNSLSGGTAAIGALALAKGGLNLYNNSATGFAEGVVKKSLGGFGNLLSGGLMGGAAGGMAGFASGFGGGGDGGGRWRRWRCKGGCRRRRGWWEWNWWRQFY